MGRILAWRRFSAKVRGVGWQRKICAWLGVQRVLAIYQERDESMNRVLLSLIRGNRAAVGFAAIAPILVIAVALALVPPALAQSTTDSLALPAAEDAAPPAIADPPADAPIDGIAPLTTAASGSASDDSAEDRSGWVRSGDVETDTANPRDKVLEVPQVVDPANAQSSGDPGQAARDGNSSSDDQVGSIDDYQDEEDAGVAGGYVNQIPRGNMNLYGINTGRMSPGINSAFGPGYVPANPSGPNIALPSGNGMNTAVGSTSPMLPHNMPPSPGGWWIRAR